MSEDEKLNIRVEMQGEMLDRFKKIKKLLGIESGTDVFRYLISNYYHQTIEKINPNARDVQLTQGIGLLTSPKIFG